MLTVSESYDLAIARRRTKIDSTASGPNYANSFRELLPSYDLAVAQRRTKIDFTASGPQRVGQTMPTVSESYYLYTTSL